LHKNIYLILEKNILQYIKDAHNGASEEKLAPNKEEIINQAREVLDALVKGGIDTRPFKWWAMPLWGLLGGAVGCGLGLGINAVTDKIKENQEQTYTT
jgi:hypothetical protein